MYVYTQTLFLLVYLKPSGLTKLLRQDTFLKIIYLYCIKFFTKFF